MKVAMKKTISLTITIKELSIIDNRLKLKDSKKIRLEKHKKNSKNLIQLMQDLVRNKFRLAKDKELPLSNS